MLPEGVRQAASSTEAFNPGEQAGMGTRHFTRLAQIIQEQVGIRLPLSKRSMVEGRLRKRVRAHGLSSLADYGDYLFEEGGLAAEIDAVIDCVTTNKTDFFREPRHFDFLIASALPHLLHMPRRRSGPLKIWSAACSNGAEAYTTAMVLHAAMQSADNRAFAILGTDIDSEVLAEARKGIYSSEFVAPVPADMQNRYLMWCRHPGRDAVRIVPELRRLARFERMNLMDMSYPLDRDIDVIFCRNVLIYFDRATQQAVIERLVSHLRPGGYLMLGHSESALGNHVDGIGQVGSAVFQRQDGLSPGMVR